MSSKATNVLQVPPSVGDERDHYYHHHQSGGAAAVPATDVWDMESLDLEEETAIKSTTTNNNTVDTHIDDHDDDFLDHDDYNNNDVHDQLLPTLTTSAIGGYSSSAFDRDETTSLYHEPSFNHHNNNWFPPSNSTILSSSSSTLGMTPFHTNSTSSRRNSLCFDLDFDQGCCFFPSTPSNKRNVIVDDNNNNYNFTPNLDRSLIENAASSTTTWGLKIGSRRFSISATQTSFLDNHNLIDNIQLDIDQLDTPLDSKDDDFSDIFPKYNDDDDDDIDDDDDNDIITTSNNNGTKQPSAITTVLSSTTTKTPTVTKPHYSRRMSLTIRTLMNEDILEDYTIVTPEQLDRPTASAALAACSAVVGGGVGGCQYEQQQQQHDNQYHGHAAAGMVSPALSGGGHPSDSFPVFASSHHSAQTASTFVRAIAASTVLLSPNSHPHGTSSSTDVPTTLSLSSHHSNSNRPPHRVGTTISKHGDLLNEKYNRTLHKLVRSMRRSSETRSIVRLQRIRLKTLSPTNNNNNNHHKHRSISSSSSSGTTTKFPTTLLLKESSLSSTATTLASTVSSSSMNQMPVLLSSPRHQPTLVPSISRPSSALSFTNPNCHRSMSPTILNESSCISHYDSVINLNQVHYSTHYHDNRNHHDIYDNNTWNETTTASSSNNDIMNHQKYGSTNVGSYDRMRVATVAATAPRIMNPVSHHYNNNNMLPPATTTSSLRTKR